MRQIMDMGVIEALSPRFLAGHPPNVVTASTRFTGAVACTARRFPGGVTGQFLDILPTTP
jgi:hypothetical protein